MQGSHVRHDARNIDALFLSFGGCQELPGKSSALGSSPFKEVIWQIAGICWNRQILFDLRVRGL